MTLNDFIHPDDRPELEKIIEEYPSNWLRIAITLAYTIGRRRGLKDEPGLTLVR